MPHFKVTDICGENVVNDMESINYKRHVLPARLNSCSYCQALMWIEERTSGTESNPHFTSCCLNGSVSMPAGHKIPQFLLHLLVDHNENAQQFRRFIRLYNSVLSFSSMSADIDERFSNNKFGVYNFRISGTIHHNIGLILPTEPSNPRFSQIYIYDSLLQAELRRRQDPEVLDINILNKLQQILEETNPYVKSFIQAGKRMRSEPYMTVNIEIKKMALNKCFDLPQCDEISVLMMNNMNENKEKIQRDVIVFSTNSEPTRISELHTSYDPLSYVLIFMYGEQGWGSQAFLLSKRINEPLTDEAENRESAHKYISARQYYNYLLYERPSSKLHFVRQTFSSIHSRSVCKN